ncbi:MAG TPA: glycosyl transferase family 2, partial [Planctomycetaceae bacterium]|nr:glycosyl transferase family 2 [Planctomycetaceae bacterium]
MSATAPLAVVLAAGKGTRMKSELPKVLFPVLGRPMVEFVLEALEAAGIRRKVVVVGYRADEVRSVLQSWPGVEFAEQSEQLGTGHAVMMCRSQIESHRGPIVIVTGDSPLLQPSSLKKLLDHFHAHHPACLLGTLEKDDPTGLGRILRNEEGEFLGIVEEKDATDEQRRIREVNMSTYVFDPEALLQSLEQLDNRNQQGEYYITDCPGILKAAGKRVE